jgi:hypothetical protein
MLTAVSHASATIPRATFHGSLQREASFAWGASAAVPLFGVLGPKAFEKILGTSLQCLTAGV